MSTTESTLKRYEMLIDAEFVATTNVLQVSNPATEEVISEFPNCTVSDVNTAVLAAEKAQKSSWVMPISI